MSSRTVVRGGLVITASDEIHADVLIEDGRVAALAATGTQAAEAFDAERVIDASGKYVIPGGVDGHTHMEMPFGGTYAADTFETGTPAAAWGGTTTIVDFATRASDTPCAPAWTPGTPRPRATAPSTTAST
ncbi:D-hydantoinase [Streptomyces violaceorubidus]